MLLYNTRKEMILKEKVTKLKIRNYTAVLSIRLSSAVLKDNYTLLFVF
jgi:hypothetical protein